MALCGHHDGPPLLPPLSVPDRLDMVAEELERRSSSRGRAVRISWPAALAGRAALLGLSRRGRMSPNGTCRLVATADRDVALSLPRPDDLEMIPALTSDAGRGDPWDAVGRMASKVSSFEFVDRARTLGLAAAVVGERVPGKAYSSTRLSEPRAREPGDPWTVVDLSSLWAGPLAARILCETGAHIVKVEDPARPDGSRNTPRFYSWLHSPFESNIRVDFRSAAGRDELARLLDTADVVIEASRPRAMEQIGLSPEGRGLRPGQVWVSITGHGRSGPQRHWVGFGDDAAIAGGLSCRDGSGPTLFCGDATADPITGLVAALAALRSLDDGGGDLIDVSLSGVAAWVTSGPEPRPASKVLRAGGDWVVQPVEGDDGQRAETVADSPPHLRFIEPLA
jgi:hypothetical protein